MKQESTSKIDVKHKTPVFEGTVAGQKFLFQANTEELKKVAEIPTDKSAEEIALAHSAELVARAKANHAAVKALYKAWAQAKRQARAATPEAIAQAAEKAAARARAKAQTAEKRAAAKAEAKKAKAAAKAAKVTK